MQVWLVRLVEDPTSCQAARMHMVRLLTLPLYLAIYFVTLAKNLAISCKG